MAICPDNGGAEPEPTVLLSMLQHYVYCPRQFALIHLEHTFDDNALTLEGRDIHKKVDEPRTTIRDGIREAHALPLWSRRYGLRGRADVIQLLPDGPFPIEYKHGPRRSRRADEVQLCAQALCLEEMLDTPVPRGAVYHHRSRARREVEFTDELRALAEQTIQSVRDMLLGQHVPPPVADRRCTRCSLKEACMPALARRRQAVAGYLLRLFDVQEETC